MNALTPPPPPNIPRNRPGNALSPMNSRPAIPGQPGNALDPQSQRPPVIPPAPSHQQTVAALRHFDAIKREVIALLTKPECGKVDLRNAIIDGVTKLVRDGIMSAMEAVRELENVPPRPFDQRKWLADQLVQATQARIAVLAHHQAGFLGQGVDDTPPDQEDHVNTMSGVLRMYQDAAAGGQGNG